MDSKKKEQIKVPSQPEKARIGAIGENEVVSKLMQHGWDAFNANCTLKNYKSIDVVCLNSDVPESCDCPWKPKTVLIQVKTSVQKNITVGFNIKQSLEQTFLEQHVKGPYVFVLADTSQETWSFRYFIISRLQFIKLLNAAHEWYVNGYHREKGISLESPAGMKVEWLEGKDEKETNNHIAFHNPLNGLSCEDKWENIWKD